MKSYEKQIERKRKGECPLHGPKGYRSEEEEEPEENIMVQIKRV